MPFAVLPALLPDIHNVYDIYFSSFTADTMGSLMVKILFPSGITPEFREQHTAGTLAYLHQSRFQYTWKCVDMETGEIVGMALGDIYLHERSEEERRDHGVPWLTGEDRERAERILGPLHEVRERLWGGHKYIYVHVVGVDPKNQGRKAGAALVQWGSDLCDHAGIPIYFESSPSTVKLYEKMGWHRLPESIVHKAADLGVDEDIEVPLMVKFPTYAGKITFDEYKAQGYPIFSR